MAITKLTLSGSTKTNILALGAQSKSSFCLVKNKTAYLSRHGGDISNFEDFMSYRKEIKRLQKRLRMRPEVVVCDLHPEYTSSKLGKEIADESGIMLKGIQHHEAHIASCMIDNNLRGNVIGVAFDGTGFGTDGNMWGGEFFAGNIKRLRRSAHLQYVPMPGGEAAVRQPWRMAIAYLHGVYGRRCKDLKIDFLDRLDKERRGLLIQIIEKQINSPLTSSMGRLFDAVSSIVNICNVASYEGQAAVELESLIKDAQGSRLKAQGTYNFSYKDEVIMINWAPVIKGVIKDLQAKRVKAQISLKFHNAICNMIKDVCVLLRRKYKINKVCLSGGVFQNKYITNRIESILEQKGFEVYLHKNIPAHDGGIALGQAAIVAAKD